MLLLYTLAASIRHLRAALHLTPLWYRSNLSELSFHQICTAIMHCLMGSGRAFMVQQSFSLQIQLFIQSRFFSVLMF